MKKKKRKKRKKRSSSIAPLDPQKYIRVKTREGEYDRRKRGTVKEATLNEVFQKNVDIVQHASPAAKRLQNILRPFIERLDTGRFIARISTLFRKAYKQKGKMDFSKFRGYEVQPYHRLSRIMVGEPSVKCRKGEVSMEINITPTLVKKLNKIVSGYFFDAVLVYGDPTKDRGLRIESDTSPIYSFKDNNTKCRLTLVLPAKRTSWMALFKVNCIEEDKPAVHPRHYGMKVMIVGEV